MCRTPEGITAACTLGFGIHHEYIYHFYDVVCIDLAVVITKIMERVIVGAMLHVIQIENLYLIPVIHKHFTASLNKLTRWVGNNV